MSFTCPRCGRVSHHPKDQEHGYCGACHEFTGTPKPVSLPFELITKVRWWKSARHVHMSLFAAHDTSPGHYAKIGELCVREEEWGPFQRSVGAGWTFEERKP